MLSFSSQILIEETKCLCELVIWMTVIWKKNFFKIVNTPVIIFFQGKLFIFLMCIFCDISHSKENHNILPHCSVFEQFDLATSNFIFWSLSLWRLQVVRLILDGHPAGWVQNAFFPNSANLSLLSNPSLVFFSSFFGSSHYGELGALSSLPTPCTCIAFFDKDLFIYISMKKISWVKLQLAWTHYNMIIDCDAQCTVMMDPLNQRLVPWKTIFREFYGKILKDRQEISFFMLW